MHSTYSKQQKPNYQKFNFGLTLIHSRNQVRQDNFFNSGKRGREKRGLNVQKIYYYDLLCLICSETARKARDASAAYLATFPGMPRVFTNLQTLIIACRERNIAFTLENILGNRHETITQTLFKFPVSTSLFKNLRSLWHTVSSRTSRTYPTSCPPLLAFHPSCLDIF